MARRRRSYRRSYARRSYSRAPRRRSSSSRGSRAGNTIRLVLQQPGMGAGARPRAPFGTFQPTALYSPFMAPYLGMGAPWPQQGGPGIPGARMVINPVPSPDVPDGGGSHGGPATA